MHIQLEKPELERFIIEEVKAGRFPSPQAAIEAAVEQMMFQSEMHEPDAETLAAIEEGEAQLDRGEGIPIEEVLQQLRKRFVK